MKKFLIALIAIIIIVLGVWWWLSANTPVVNEGTPVVSRTFFPRAGETVSNFIDSVTGGLSDNFGIDNQAAAPALQVVVKEPIASADLVTVGTTSVIIYVEKGTGHIYRLNPGSNEPTRLSAATLAPVIATTWAQDAANTYFFIQTNQGAGTTWHRLTLANKALTATSTEPVTTTIRLAGTIESITPAPDHKTIFSLEVSNGKLIGNTSKPDGTNRSTVWSSNYLDWRAWWSSTDFIYLATKADSLVPSAVYRLNLKTKVAERLLGGGNGISLIPETGGERLIYTTTRFNSFSTYSFNPTTKQSAVLPIVTMPEKCFWPKGNIVWCFVPQTVPTNNYPEAWYQGVVSFSDNLQRLDLTTSNSSIIADPTTLNLAIDGIKPFIDQTNNYLYFINKSDSLLWQVNVQNVF